MTSYRSYWLATAPGCKTTPHPPEPHYDVGIVGAGFTGLSAARHLAKAGKKVAVFERVHLGAGASGRNGGHLNNGIAHGYADAVAMLGPNGARRLYHAYDAGIDLIEQTIAEESISCDFRRSGKIKIASKPDHVAALRANFELINQKADRDTEFLTKEDLAGEVVTGAAHAGLLYRKSAMMHMGRYLHGLARATLRHGGQIFEHCPVRAFGRTPDGWSLETETRPVTAKHLVLAGGATGGRMMGAVGRMVLPIGSYIIVTRPLTPTEIEATLPGRRTYVTSLNIGTYFRLAPDDRLIFGGRARFSTSAGSQADKASEDILKRTLGRMFPTLAGIDVEHCFGGLVDMTPDRLPRVGMTAEGALFAIGYSGHGAQMSAYLGALLSDMILGTHAARLGNPLDSLTLPMVPTWARHLVPLLGAYYRVKDILR